MDAFLISLSDLCNQIMPILGAAVLIVLIVLLAKLIKMVESADNTLNRTHVTIDLVDKSIEKAQAPLDTVVKLSGTVDKAHDATVDAVNKTKEFVTNNSEEIKDFVIRNAENIKDKVVSFVSPEEETKEPSPEDIIGR
ncbi:MAG: hypothetical protein Q4D13_02010 [Erysipelotrichaceae bacterium]|nr:hypothetical protein [Erysipelotrichaceae bacterium]